MVTALDIISYLPRFLRNLIVPAMPIPDVTNSPSKVQLIRLSHVYFEHPDLAQFCKFAADFGFVEASRSADGETIYFRGYGVDPYVYVATKAKPPAASSNKKKEKARPKFLGPAFVARDQAEFDKATKLPGAGDVMSLEHAPGGGKQVTITRPNGTFMHIVFGQIEREVDVSASASASANTTSIASPDGAGSTTETIEPSATHDSQGPFNTPFHKHRFGQFQRYHAGPALVHKLGHFGYVCKEFDDELAFYTSHFNFTHSDILWHPQFPKIDVLTFMHLDLGATWVDHHIFFMQRAAPDVERTYVHHTSYEVADFDTQLIGHEWLAKKGWKSVWGVGRHILGSQIFDYWSDASGFKIEHYADGDLVNETTATRREVAGPISVWGPELPKDFGEDGTKVLFPL